MLRFGGESLSWRALLIGISKLLINRQIRCSLNVATAVALGRSEKFRRAPSENQKWHCAAEGRSFSGIEPLQKNHSKGDLA